MTRLLKTPRPTRPSLANFLLVVFALAVVIALFVGATRLIERWQSLRCPSGTFLVGSGRLASLLQDAPLFLALFGVGSFFVFWAARSIPPLRWFFFGDAKRHYPRGYRQDMRELLKWIGVAQIVLLPITFAASLSHYCLADKVIWYQHAPGRT